MYPSTHGSRIGSQMTMMCSHPADDVCARKVVRDCGIGLDSPYRSRMRYWFQLLTCMLYGSIMWVLQTGKCRFCFQVLVLYVWMVEEIRGVLPLRICCISRGLPSMLQST